MKCTIHQDDEQWLTRQREQDRFIMEDAADLPDITGNELAQVQRCRLYLEATTLADITTSDGRKLDEAALNGT